MRTLFIIVALCCVSVCYGRQKTRWIPADSLSNTFTIRGHILPWTFGNDGGIGYAIGGEYNFKKVHAIGVDVAYTDGHSGPEVYDSVLESYRIPFHQWWVSRSILFSYKYYLSCREGASDSYRPYLGAFIRLGNLDYHPDDGYISPDPTQRNQIKYDEQQRSVGLLFGVISPYRMGRLNIDINTGPFWKWKTMQDIRLENAAEVTHHLSVQNFGWRMGFNVSFICRRKTTADGSKK